MVGWHGVFEEGSRPSGIHPLASVGGPPEHRGWMVGDPVSAPEIASSALIHAFCTVDAGMTYKQTTTVGERSFLMSGSHLGHNAVVGDDCEIGNHVVVGGEATIGDGVRIGGNSWVKPLATIGDGAIIGGGSVVTRDVPSHEVWCGNPARYLKLAWTHPGFAAVAAKSTHPYRELNG
jgi:UDP-N-acetylglucosamine acyltransferase